MDLGQKCITLLVSVLPLLGAAQFQTLNPIRFASFYTTSTLQSNQQVTDSLETFKQGSFSLGLVLPVIHKEWTSTQDRTNTLDVQLHPALNYIRVQTHLSERILHNPQLTAASFLGFGRVSRLSLHLRLQLNEDEFTASYPRLKANGTGYYSRNIRNHWRIHAGAGYSYILGSANWYPILGTDFSLSKRSRLILMYPLLANYQYTPHNRLLFSLFAKPTGILSYWENRLTIPDTSQKELIFSLQGVSTGLEVSWLLIPSITLSVSTSYCPPQILQLQHSDSHFSYVTHHLSEAISVNASLIWRPWQTGKRNSKTIPYNFSNDANFVVPF